MSHIYKLELHVCHIPVMSHYARPRQTPQSTTPVHGRATSPAVRQSPDWSCGRLGGLTQASAFQHHPLTQANDLLTGKNWKVNDSGEGAQEQETFLKTQVYNGLPMFPHISLVALTCSTAHARQIMSGVCRSRTLSVGHYGQHRRDSIVTMYHIYYILPGSSNGPSIDNSGLHMDLHWTPIG